MCHRNFCKASMKHILVKPLQGDALQSPFLHLLKLKGNKIPNLLYHPPSRTAHLSPSAPSPWPVALSPFTSTLQTTARSSPASHCSGREQPCRCCRLICLLTPSLLFFFCSKLHSPCFFTGLDVPQPVSVARRGRGVSSCRRHSEVGQ